MDDHQYRREIQALRGLLLPSPPQCPVATFRARASQVAARVSMALREGPAAVLVVCPARHVEATAIRIFNHRPRPLGLKWASNTEEAKALASDNGGLVTVLSAPRFAAQLGPAKTAPWHLTHVITLDLPIEYDETARNLWPLASVAVLGDPAG